MTLDDILFDEVLLVKTPLSWAGNFMVGDDSDRESPGSTVDDAVRLLLAEVGELADKGLFSRRCVFLDIESRLRQLASSVDPRRGVDVDAFVAAAKRTMARIVPAMDELLRSADLTIWLNVYARIAHRVPRSQRAHLVWRDTSDECSVGWWEARIGANSFVSRVARLVGMYRGLPASEVAMAVVSTFEDLATAMAADIAPGRVAEIVRMAHSLVHSVENRTDQSGLAGYQGLAGREVRIDRLPWAARFEAAQSSLRSMMQKVAASA
ncbi:hypothetical protein OIU34_22375 [Pararhizobium sp. BT-229]|uniref:hypothetical protein n=1 Tax=Pararhizobium sp. BT-229 TaxID=2986923 RepID=UPI0021F79607|nr:hypothetical protein [Pararhizobium sp. BT-229]MCV9964641.1 hypothetical protein [Pararhizobium sp. BT-229]